MFIVNTQKKHKPAHMMTKNEYTRNAPFRRARRPPAGTGSFYPGLPPVARRPT